MSIFSRWAPGATAVGLVTALAHCGPGPTACLRYTDCDPGLTCAYGHCVYPPVASDASLDAPASSGLSEASTGDDSAPASDDSGASGDDSISTGDDSSASGDDSTPSGDDASAE